VCKNSEIIDIRNLEHNEPLSCGCGNIEQKEYSEPINNENIILHEPKINNVSDMLKKISLLKMKIDDDITLVQNKEKKYTPTCPKCSGNKVSICKCFRHDKICRDCGYKWHVCQNGEIIDLSNTKHSDPLPCDCKEKSNPLIIKNNKISLATENGEKFKDNCVRKINSPIEYYKVGGSQTYCLYCGENCLYKTWKKTKDIDLKGYFDCACTKCNPI
jgi:hypothetical protein